uniref:EF-hand domain-containing protein n=1 Tax=Kalanchoe fedtschenkoi TaxID=63787 RepID=A0A7N0TBZ1_KALFE
MAGYPPPNYGYGPPPPNQPYGAPPPPYGAQPQSHKPAPSAPYGAPSAPYGAPSAPYGSPYASPPPSDKPPKEQGGSSVYHVAHVGPGAPYGSQSSGYPTQYQPTAPPYGGGQSPFASLVPSAFPPGTDPNVVACFQLADRDGSGFIDDKELQAALSSYNQSFNLRTVHLLMYLFTNSNSRKIGPKEFTQVFYSLQNWRSIFERFDRDRSGKIDPPELREALLSLGFSVSPVVLDLLVLKFDKSGGKNRAIEYDNFIECCLTVKGLTEKFKEKDTSYSGSATFGYEDFMLTVLPFLIA